MQAFVCVKLGHKIAKEVRSGWLLALKGNRDAALFDGTLYICECGKEIYHGRPQPWFEGSIEDVKKMLTDKAIVGENIHWPNVVTA